MISARNAIDMTQRESSGPEVCILVNEQDPRFRKLLELYLKVEGFTPIVTSTPDEVMQLFVADPNRIDVLITNVVMRSGNGLSLAQACQRIKPGLSVIFVSSESVEELLANHELEIPRQQFLRKPFNVRTLTRKIAEVMTS